MKKTRPPVAHIPPFGLRLQPDLKAQLERAAVESGRSLNAEIAQRLHDSFVPYRDLPEFIRDSVQRHAEASGRSFASEVESRLTSAEDPVLGWLEEALEPAREEIAQEADRKGWPIKQEIEQRLTQYRPTIAYGVRLEIKSEVELMTSGVLQFLSMVSEKLNLRRLERIDVRVFPPANRRADDEPAPIYVDQLNDYPPDEVFGPGVGEQDANEK